MGVDCVPDDEPGEWRQDPISLAPIAREELGAFRAFCSASTGRATAHRVFARHQLYNQIAIEVSKRITDVMRLVRLLDLVHTAMADASIAIWESKYHYHFWRPVTGIRETYEGAGPSDRGDRNPATIGDTAFSPLGAPASDLTGPNFTPPFPAYPSGHAGFGGALFQTLRKFSETDFVDPGN